MHHDISPLMFVHHMTLLGLSSFSYTARVLRTDPVSTYFPFSPVYGMMHSQVWRTKPQACTVVGSLSMFGRARGKLMNKTIPNIPSSFD